MINKEKSYLQAIIRLGFKFLTKDMNGKIHAWKKRPRRLIYFLDNTLKDIIKIYGDKDIYIHYRDEDLGDSGVIKVKDGVLNISCYKSDSDKPIEYECLGIEEKELFDWLEWEDGVVSIQERLDNIIRNV